MQALKGFTLTVRSGEFVALIGPSGCGKSTVLRIAAGLEVPSAGATTVGGGTPEAFIRGRRLGVAFQDHALLPWLTVEQNIAVPFKLAGRKPSKEEIGRLVQLVGLSGFGAARPKQLSGGMRQRVAIARALALSPALLLLDEPFGALDAVTRHRLNLELASLWASQRITTLLVTHSVEEAVFLADRVVIMSGRPGTIKRVVPVTFERPRSKELLGKSDFQQLVAQLTELLDDVADEQP